MFSPWGRLNSWVVSHSALIMGTLRHALGHEYEPWVAANSFLDPSTTSMLYLWFYLVYLVWYYYLSVKFVMWIVKQKIENKRNFFLNVMFSPSLKRLERPELVAEASGHSVRTLRSWRGSWVRPRRTNFCLKTSGPDLETLLQPSPEDLMAAALAGLGRSCWLAVEQYSASMMSASVWTTRLEEKGIFFIRNI